MMNKSNVARECERNNAARKVYPEKMDHITFFQKVQGNVLVSGMQARQVEFVKDMAKTYHGREDLPTIVLTSRLELLRQLKEGLFCENPSQAQIFGPFMKNHHPMHGMNAQQVCQIIQAAGKELGCGAILDQVLLYAMALLNIVSLKYPISLPAISRLLQSDDDAIAEFAFREGASNIICGNIVGSQMAGIMLRRIVERLEETFENIYDRHLDTECNFQGFCCGNNSMVAFYQASRNQGLMNLYLKEEIYRILQHTPKVRIILDEALFVEESDCLLRYLLQLKRSGQAEVVASSGNAMKMLYGEVADFTNTCLFPHDVPAVTEELSGQIFGKYQYHYPVLTAGKPPALFFTLQSDFHWAIAAEGRLRVRAVDLEENKPFGGITEAVAIKTGNSLNVYLVPVPIFLGVPVKKFAIGKFAVRKEQEKYV